MKSTAFIKYLTLVLILTASTGCSQMSTYESGILVVDEKTGEAKVVSKSTARKWDQDRVLFPTKSEHEWCMENPDCKEAWRQAKIEQTLDFMLWFAQVYNN